MSTTLTTLRDRVEQVLADSSNLIWSTADLDEAIRQALQEYSIARPLAAVKTLTLAASGREISLASVSGGAFTVTIASPGVFTLAAHGLSVGQRLRFSTTGALPTGLAISTDYWVKTVPTADTFTVASTKGGTAVNTSVSQSGTHTATVFAYDGLMSVTEIWVPYTAASPEHPANYRQFQHWFDLQKIYIDGDYEPAAADVLRLFYTQAHELSGLDGAAVTTYTDNHDSILITGSCGYAATSRAVNLAEKVTIDKLTGQQVRAWGLSKLQEFRSKLKEVTRMSAMQGRAVVELPALDRWDRLGETGRKWS